MRNTLIALLAAGILSTSACNSMNMSKESTISDKDKVVALLNSIETGDPAPVGYINPEKYIQHNLAVADGVAGFGAVLQALPKGTARVDVKRVFQDGNYVFTHTGYNFFGPKTGFDIFRFEDGRIVEHWDNLTEKTPPNPSGRTQLDGPVKVTDIARTEENKALVAEFVDSILIKGQFSELTRFIEPGKDNYLQHNSTIADGLSGLDAAIKAMAAQGISMSYSKSHKILGEGNFVLAISEGEFAGQHVAFYDLFRVSQGKIVEHWDVIEQIPARKDWKNTNGKFGFTQ